MRRFCTSLLIVICAPLVFAQEGANQGRSEAVFIDIFSADAPPLIDNESISDWLNDELSLQLNLSDADGLDLSEQVSSVNNYNVRRVQQSHAGIPVVGYESRLVLDAEGNLIGLVGQHQGFSGTAPTQAQLSADDAVQAAGFGETTFVAETPVYFEVDGELRLSWHIEGRSAEAGENIPAGERLYIDAVSGEELARYPMVYSAMTREVGDMIKACRAAGVSFPLSPEEAWPVELMVEEEEYHRSEGEASEGAQHVDAMYDMLGDAYHFMENVLGMDSLDDSGLRLKAIVGIRYGPEGYYNQCVGDVFNATWHSGYNELYIPDYALSYIEIIAHELTHGIVSNGSDLVYEFESGALDEGISDSIGISFKAWRQAGGRLGGQSPANIPTSPDLWLLDSPIGVLRDMRNPRNVDNNPDHYDVYNDFPLENDQGGVHSNSSIINQAFYILVEGGRHPRLGTGPDVQGIGITNAALIYATAAANLLTPYADFQDARNAFALAAELHFDKYSDVWVAVHESMDAVGIPGSWQRQAPTPPPVLIPTPIPTQDPVTPDPVTPDPVSTPPVPDSAPAPTAPAPTANDAGNNNALYLGVGVVFVMFALFLLSKLRPDLGTAAPEYRRSASDSSPAATPRMAPEPLSVQHIAVSRSRSVGRLAGAGTSASIELDESLMQSKEGLVIGRSRNLNHVALEDPRVSRRHLRLRKEGSILLLEDLNSTHGTNVNGNPVQPYARTVINQGDSIEIAGIRFICDLN